MNRPGPSAHAGRPDGTRWDRDRSVESPASGPDSNGAFATMDQAPRGPRIEFVGAPGAGKSTIFAAAAARSGWVDRRDALYLALRQRSSDRVVSNFARAVPRRLGQRHAYTLFHRSRDFPRSYFVFAARHPELSALVADMTLVHAAPTARTWRIFQKHASAQSVHEYVTTRWSGGDAPELLDEEFVQMLLISLAGTSAPATDRLIDRYLELVPRPDVVVAVRARPETCRRRVDVRSGDRAWPTVINPGDEDGFLARMDEAMEAVLAAVRSSGTTVVEVDNDGPPPAPSEVRRTVEAAMGRR